MPRGGRRQGTPGKAYSNRTDLGVDYNMDQEATPAAGGIEAPMGEEMAAYPEDTPNLSDPTQRPDEPITAGLALGDGPGPEVLEGRDPRIEETKKLKRWLPLLTPLADDPEAPDSFRTFVRYLRGA